MDYTMIWYLLAALVLIFILRKVQLRLQLSMAKHRSLTGHARIARRLAALNCVDRFELARHIRSGVKYWSRALIDENNTQSGKAGKKAVKGN